VVEGGRGGRQEAREVQVRSLAARQPACRRVGAQDAGVAGIVLARGRSCRLVRRMQRHPLLPSPSPPMAGGSSGRR